MGKVTKNVILDAELVAFSDYLGKIDGKCPNYPYDGPNPLSELSEFWRIRSLITSTARGARASMFGAPHKQADSHDEP
jgi:DNA ligase-4